MGNNRCAGCKHFWCDYSTNACECKIAEQLTEEKWDRHFGEDEPNCPHWESSYHPEEEAYIEKLMEEPAYPKITLSQIQEALKHGYHVTVIINGEYYEYKEEN